MSKIRTTDKKITIFTKNYRVKTKFKMAKIRITKEFNFEMAHALHNYDGLCKHIHGHSYKLFVTVIGTPCKDENNPKLGMVIDFGELKKIVNQQIVNIYDHALVISQKAREVIPKHQMFEKTMVVNYQPTSENMLIHFAEKIQKELPKKVKLHSIKLYETATSFAEWVADDNDE